MSSGTTSARHKHAQGKSKIDASCDGAVGSTAELIAAYYPDVPVVRPMGRYDALIANDRAAHVLGFVPQMSWRDEIAPESIPTTV